jgi:hypothetical protein
MNMDENLKQIKKSLTQFTSFKILHEKINPGVFEILEVWYLAENAYSGGSVFAYFENMTHKT